jgi:hypothetical protein
VRLLVVVGDGGVGSVLRFADTPDEVITDPGNAKGSLADAVEQLWRDAVTTSVDTTSIDIATGGAPRDEA